MIGGEVGKHKEEFTDWLENFATEEELALSFDDQVHVFNLFKQGAENWAATIRDHENHMAEICELEEWIFMEDIPPKGKMH